MKLRIQDNSVRFRITLRELERLTEDGVVASEAVIPPFGSSGTPVRFCYEIRRTHDGRDSSLEVTERRFSLVLGDEDFAQLYSDEREGVYVRREWVDTDGLPRRFIVFVEKDRPGSACEKPEAWVYEHVPGSRPVTRPIGGRGGSAGGAAR